MNDAQTTKKPSTTRLFSDQAIDELTSMLSMFADPDEVLQKAGLSRADLRRLEGDDEVSAALETRLNACLSTPWRIEPGDGEVVDFVWDQMARHFECIVTAAWRAVPYGYSVIEAIYQRAGDQIIWSRLEERPFEWFRPTPDGSLRYFPRNGSGGANGIEVDTTFKFFLTRRRPTSRNPYGEALLSRLYWPWFFRTNGWKFWARFLERFGSPLLIGKTTGSTKEMADALAKAVQSAVMAVGTEDAVDAVSSSGGGDAFAAFSASVDRRIQKVILGQTLTTDVDGKGSYAAAKVHNEVRHDRRMADIRLITGTVQRMINALVAINYPAAEPPIFVMEDGTGLELDRAERDAKLAQAGIAKFTRDYLLRAYDFEPDDFDIPEGQQAGAQGTRGGARASMMLAAHEDRGEFTQAQQAVEDLADNVLLRARSPIPVTKIKAAIRAAKDPADLADKLASLYDEHDPKRFRAILERALFAADVMGYVHMDEQD